MEKKRTIRKVVASGIIFGVALVIAPVPAGLWSFSDIITHAVAILPYVAIGGGIAITPILARKLLPQLSFKRRSEKETKTDSIFRTTENQDRISSAEDAVDFVRNAKKPKAP
ncbi:MAG: hypothetical protein ACE5J2_07885 [Nitrososphaerales archaeon]